MNRLDQHVLREIGTPSLLALGVVSFFALGNEIRQQVEEVVAFVTVGDIAKLSVLFFPLLVSYVVPITYLLGILMAFGRLAKQGEITAARAGGISLKRMIAPVVIVGAILSGVCLFVQDVVQPWSIKKAFAIVYSELPQRATLDALPAGIMHEYEGWRVYFEQKDSETGVLYNIDLVRPEEERGSTIFYAASAKLQYDNGNYELVLDDGHLVTEDNLRLGFSQQRLTMPGPSAVQSSQVRKAKSLSELMESEKELQAQFEKLPTQRGRHTLSKERNEIARRLSWPFAAVAVSLVGAPLGVRSRSGGRSFAFAAGFSIILTYGVLQVFLQPQSLAPLLEVVLRAWIPNAMMIALGIALIWKVDRV